MKRPHPGDPPVRSVLEHHREKGMLSLPGSGAAATGTLREAARRREGERERRYSSVAEPALRLASIDFSMALSRAQLSAGCAG